MKLSRRTRIAAAVAGAASFALIAAGCSSSGGGGSSSDPVNLTVTTFGTMGFDKLYSQYEKEHPGVKIKATNIDTGDNALTDWQTKQAAGSGLPDVQAVEEGWLSKVMQVSDQFNDLKDYGANDIKDRWVDWKLKQATDKSGRIIGYGTDIGPEGLCYNGKLLAAAGLPSDRESVAKLFGGENATWDDFFKVGEQYHAATGKPWYDQSGFIWNAMVNQQDEGYYTTDGKLNIEDNSDLKALWSKLAGGAANWGGSFLTVPKQSKHPKEAAALAAWLTTAKSQVQTFQAAGTFPSVTEAQTDSGVTGESDLTKFFNNAPVGQILGERAKGVVAQYKGPDDSVIQSQVFGPSVQQLDSGKANGDQAWSNAMTLLNQLVVNK